MALHDLVRSARVAVEHRGQDRLVLVAVACGIGPPLHVQAQIRLYRCAQMANLRHQAGTAAQAVQVVVERFVTLDLTNLGNLLVVIYTYREPDIIRVISAWKANKRQRVFYEKGRS